MMIDNMNNPIASNRVASLPSETATGPGEVKSKSGSEKQSDAVPFDSVMMSELASLLNAQSVAPVPVPELPAQPAPQEMQLMTDETNAQKPLQGVPQGNPEVNLSPVGNGQVQINPKEMLEKQARGGQSTNSAMDSANVSDLQRQMQAFPEIQSQAIKVEPHVASSNATLASAGPRKNLIKGSQPEAVSTVATSQSSFLSPGVMEMAVTQETGAVPVEARPQAKLISGADFMNLRKVKDAETPIQPMVTDTSNHASLKPVVGPVYERPSGDTQIENKETLPVFGKQQLANQFDVQNTTAFVAPQPVLQGNRSQKTIEVPAYVVKGSMARDRFSSESVSNLTQQIGSISPQGGGNIRIRLQPDSLGELQLNVTTLGDHVSLKIHASDENAKKIIQDSLGFLKESLADRNLKLGRVDLGLIQNLGSSSLSNDSSNSGQNSFGQTSGGQQTLSFFDQSNGQGARQGYRDSHLGFSEDNGFMPRTRKAEAIRGLTGLSSMSGGMATKTGAHKAEGRIDVMA